MEEIPKPLQEIMLSTTLKYLYTNAHSMGNKHEIRKLRVPRDKILDERRMQEKWLIFEKNLLQAQEHAMLVHPPPCSSSGHSMISERLIGHHPLSRCCWLSRGCYPTPGSHFHHHLLRRCKGTRCECCTEHKGNFSQGPCAYSLGLCAWECECAVESTVECSLLDSSVCWVCK